MKYILRFLGIVFIAVMAAVIFDADEKLVEKCGPFLQMLKEVKQ